jgi:hypothetical protein
MSWGLCVALLKACPVRIGDNYSWWICICVNPMIDFKSPSELPNIKCLRRIGGRMRDRGFGTCPVGNSSLEIRAVVRGSLNATNELQLENSHVRKEKYINIQYSIQTIPTSIVVKRSLNDALSP